MSRAESESQETKALIWTCTIEARTGKGGLVHSETATSYIGPDEAAKNARAIMASALAQEDSES